MVSSSEIVFVRWLTIRYDTRCYFNVRSKADMIQLNLPHPEEKHVVIHYRISRLE